MPFGADMPAPGAAAGAVPAPQHGVPGHPDAQPARVHPGTERGHHTAPLVPRPERVTRLALSEVSQLPGEQLDVGPADPGPADVDHHLPGPGLRGLLDSRGPRAGDHQCAHQARLGHSSLGRQARR